MPASVPAGKPASDHTVPVICTTRPVPVACPIGRSNPGTGGYSRGVFQAADLLCRWSTEAHPLSVKRTSTCGHDRPADVLTAETADHRVKPPEYAPAERDTWWRAEVREFLTAATSDRLHAAWRLTLPVAQRWSRKHADTQRRLCQRFALPVIAGLVCQHVKAIHMQQVVNARRERPHAADDLRAGDRRYRRRVPDQPPGWPGSTGSRPAAVRTGGNR